MSAYLLMVYEDLVTHEREIIWNSRDGVSPRTIASREGNRAAFVERLRYAPDHVPCVGDRVIVDITEVRARVLAEQSVERELQLERSGAPHGGRNLEERFASRDAALQAAYASIFVPGAPDLLVVTAGWLEALAQRRASILPELALPEPVLHDEVPAPLEEPVNVWGYDRQCRPIIDFDTWRRLSMHDSYYLVARTEITATLYVSTVWLGQDHSLRRGDRPVIFETKCFKPGREEVGPTRRYCTEAEALKGHGAVVAAMRKRAGRNA